MGPGRLLLAAASVVLVIGGLGYAAAQTVMAPRTLEPGPVGTALLPQPQPSLAAPAAPATGTAQVSAPQVDEAWVADIAARAGIPAPGVRAYANAQLREPEGCTVGWTTLAGIGWVESQHGTVDGRTIGDDGRSSTPDPGAGSGRKPVRRDPRDRLDVGLARRPRVGPRGRPDAVHPLDLGAVGERRRR